MLINVESTEIMKANLSYLSNVFKEDFYTNPTIGKKRILDLLTESLSLMTDCGYEVSNIAIEPSINGLVYIYITDSKGLTFRIYNGIMNKRGTIETSYIDLRTDLIKNEKLAEELEIIVNLLFFILRTSYIKNSPFIHGLKEFDELPDMNDEYDFDDIVDENDIALGNRVLKGDK